MKCLCGYNQSPNNTKVLATHMQDCMVSGKLKGLVPDPVVVWRDGELMVVKEAEEGETVIDMMVVRPRPHVLEAEKRVYVESAPLRAVAMAVETPEELESVLDEVAAGGDVPVPEDAD